jgi:hypothetical protein
MPGCLHMPSMRLAEPYAPRPVRCLHVADLDGWRIKVCGIAYSGEVPEEGLVDAALAVARRRLPSPASSDNRYGVGFLGVHQGRASNFVFLDWWEEENELHHHVWFSSRAEPTTLREQRPADPIACAWDIAVLAHERTAWVSHVLANPRGPDLDAYLDDQLNGDV